MSALDQVLDNVRAWNKNIRTRITKSLFGANNEKLDFVMDSFYKLNPQQRNLALAGSAGGLAFIVIIVLAFYFASVSRLESELNDGFAALYRLQSLKKDYAAENKNFDALIDSVQRKTQSVALKPLFQKIAETTKVNLQDIQEKTSDLPADSALAEKMKYANVQVSFNKISIPRLMKFLVEIERSKSFLTVSDLEVRARYQDALYFDVDAKIRGYSVER